VKKRTEKQQQKTSEARSEKQGSREAGKQEAGSRKQEAGRRWRKRVKEGVWGDLTAARWWSEPAV